MATHQISLISKPTINVNTTASVYTEDPSTHDISVYSTVPTVANTTFLPETSFVINSATPNPAPIVPSTVIVAFTATDVPSGKFLGFRLSSTGGSSDFEFTTTDTTNFTATTPLAIADKDATLSGSTMIWTTNATTDPNTIASIPISISCVATTFPTPATVNYSIDLYVADNNTDFANLSSLGSVSQTDTSTLLQVTAVEGDVSTIITSYAPTVLATVKDAFTPSAPIAIKAVLTKGGTSKNLTDLVFSIAIPAAGVNYSAGSIYISKVDNTGAITDFNGTTIPATDYFTTTLAANSTGIDVTTTPGTITVTLSGIPDSAKFIDGTNGVLSPLYVFITGTVV